MRRFTALLLPAMLSLAIALTSCGGGSSSASDAAAAPASGTTAAAADQVRAFAVDESTRLLIGTFSLEDTDLAVTQDQASQLLPLWQMLQALDASTTSSQVEKDAAVSGIRKAMSSEQLEAIEEMPLTGQEMTTLMQSLGVLPEGAGAAAEDGQSRQPPAGFEPGDRAGGGGPQSGEAFSQADVQAVRATREAEGGGFGQRNAALYPSLIELLQGRATGTR